MFVFSGENLSLDSHTQLLSIVYSHPLEKTYSGSTSSAIVSYQTSGLSGKMIAPSTLQETDKPWETH